MGQVIYTDLNGQGYDLPALQAAWNDPTFQAANSRVGDILAQYAGQSAPPSSAPAPTAPTAPTGGTTYLTPGYVPPPPGPNASAPRPSVNPGVVYTDLQGNGYDVPALRNAWNNNPAFKADPANARVGDILGQYANVTSGDNSGAGGGGGGGVSGTDWQALLKSVYGTPPAIPQAPAFSFDPWNAPAPYQAPVFNAPAPFSAPSGQDVLAADPGYQFRVDQGTQALQQSAAAQGVLNTGGTLQDLINYGQAAGSQEYSNAYNRDLGTYQTNYQNALGAFNTNASNAYNAYNTNFQGGLNSWIANENAAYNQYQENYQTQTQNPYMAQISQYLSQAQLQNQLFNQQFNTANA